MEHISVVPARSVAAYIVANHRVALWAIIGVSVLLNTIVLAGSVYMMLVYDFVLPSHSTSTLLGLLVLLIVVYGFQALLDHSRARLFALIGAALGRDLIGALQNESIARAARAQSANERLEPVRDLDQLRAFLGGPGPAGLIDLPWVLFFLAVLALFNVWLGVAATAGAVVLVVLTVATDRATRDPSRAAAAIAVRRAAAGDRISRHIEVVRVLGMTDRLKAGWDAADRSFLDVQLRLASVAVGYGGASRIFRTFLQSAVLTVGVALVLKGRATAGVIFASSILSARALAPIDSTIANWRGLLLARDARRRLDSILARPAPSLRAVAMPAPSTRLSVEGLTLVPPGGVSVVVSDVSFSAGAGDALCILGPSASGKSSLVRGIVGFWPARRGNVRLDGATLDQWSPEVLGLHIGYMPQTVELLDGSIAQNICRFDPSPPEGTILAAAKAAGVHDMIVRLPKGYDTPIGASGAALSGGQQQRIGLARALYGDPFLVVLDEPNSNLDADGDAALLAALAAVRERGGLAILVAHRPNMLAIANLVMLMDGGTLRAFGRKEEVLPRILAAPPPAEKPEASDAGLVGYGH